MIGRCPRAHQAQRSDGIRPRHRFAGGLAIDGDDFASTDLVQGADPAQQTPLEGHRIQGGEDAAERVVGWYAMSQIQVLGKPVPPQAGKAGHFLPRISTGDDATHGHEHEVQQRMGNAAAPLAWIGQAGEEPLDGNRGKRGRACHGFPP